MRLFGEPGNSLRQGGQKGPHLAPKVRQTRPDPHIHSLRSPNALHFEPGEPQVHSARSPKSLRELHISTPRIKAKYLSELRISVRQLFKLSSVLSQTLKASPATHDLLTVN